LPKYDYKCENCKSEIEFERGFGEDTEPVCTTCHVSMTRVWTPTAAIFRGGGWGGQ